MSNAANELAALLRRWEQIPQNVTPEKARAGDGVGEAGSVEFWETHVRAAGYLHEIRRLIDGMEMGGSVVEPYRTAYPRWCEAVFAFNTPWRQNSNGTKRVCDKRDLSMLEALGGFLEHIEIAPEQSADEREALRRAVEEAKALVDDSPELRKEVKQYLYSLINEVTVCLDEFDKFGSVSVRGISLQLGGAMQIAATSVEDETRRRKMFNTAGQIIYPAMSSGLVEVGKWAVHLLGG